MTKIPEAVIEAAFGSQTDRFGDRYAEDRARRVIKALAENLPESSVEKALRAFYAGNHGTLTALRAAIIAALLDVGGDNED